ncbi:MAG: phenylalanine--tRNA ligase subunit alpha [Alphaproteobacteria bacterium]
MSQEIEIIIAEASSEINDANSVSQLEELRIKYLGKNGLVTSLLKQVSSLTIDEKKQFGAKVNQAKEEIAANIHSKKEILEIESINEKLITEALDVTLPVREKKQGKIHPISQVTEELIAIFGTLGFSFAEGPEIEDDYHNFTALNVPENHPARAMQDTFYLPNNYVLRTHTSSVQIRTMEAGKPPFKIISIGKTYRSESDMTHTPMFHQFEGLYIDKKVNMGHLKNCIIEFVKKFFEIDDLPVRFRASFFPFTEPSAEVDIGCHRENGEFKIGPGKSWMEILGCGMVHPNVLKNVGIDPDEYQGFAFGGGVERLAMLKYGIADLRSFFEGDLRWIEHYEFSPFIVPSIIGGLSR